MVHAEKGLAGMQQPVPATKLAEVHQRIVERNDRIADSIMHLEALADRLWGSEVPSETKNPPTDQRAAVMHATLVRPTVEQIEDALVRQHHLAIRLEHVMKRLGAL
mgnify:CR=1 FL=1